MSDSTWGLDPHGLVLLHAAAVRARGGAWIFLGPSGAGKSTISGLLAGLAQPLADDLVYLISEDEDGWAVADARERVVAGPLSEEAAAALRGPPLRAIFRLYQAASPRLEPISALESCRHLVESFFSFYWHRDYGTAAKKDYFARLAALARRVPGYRLYFDPSPRVAEMIGREILH